VSRFLSSSVKCARACGVASMSMTTAGPVWHRSGWSQRYRKRTHAEDEEDGSLMRSEGEPGPVVEAPDRCVAFQ